MDIASGIFSTAKALGIDPIDLATAISYETGGTFNPLELGPETKFGQHRGLIQFGEPQANQYGVSFETRPQAISTQLGPGAGIFQYLKAVGVEPGMGLDKIYSAINTGGVNNLNMTDERAGGMPGTVAEKVAGMGDHRKNAQKFMELAMQNQPLNTPPIQNQPLNANPKLGPINTGQPQKKVPSLFDFVGKTVGGGYDKLKAAVTGEDPDASDRLAVALMSLSGNPGQFKPMIEMAVKDINERKVLNRGKNNTIAYLQKLADGGDNTAAAALRLVDSQGPAQAIKSYMTARSANSAAANKTAASTKTYSNGLTVSLFQDGTKQVRDGTGALLTGPAATEAIKVAQADEIEQGRLLEFETKSASAKAGMVQSTVSSIINVDSSLRNYAKAKRSIRDAIRDNKDISGFLTQYFPDISVEAAELTNARNALGLDVVGSVTFGALSKGELDLALSQGLPLGLNEPQLLEYIERRELALKKYRQSLMEAARIYADPQKDFNDYLDSISDTEVTNPYRDKRDDELEDLFIQVQSGNSRLSAKKRQFIIDEVNRRAEL